MTPCCSCRASASPTALVEAVHEVNLDVHEGEIVTVIGPNGAGKTTLLSAAMGLLPSKGSISWKASALPGPA